MSFMDKLKAMISGGSDSQADSHEGHSHAGHDHSDDRAVAVDEVPPVPAAPLDPLGTSMPEAGPVPTSIPPAADEKD